jgi:hypothetical protein
MSDKKSDSKTSIHCYAIRPADIPLNKGFVVGGPVSSQPPASIPKPSPTVVSPKPSSTKGNG